MKKASLLCYFRWQEAMRCLDRNNHNPFPKLVAYLPMVAEQVLDRCITLQGDPDGEDFCVTYNFEYVDINPEQTTEKVWYIMVCVSQKALVQSVETMRSFNQTYSYQLPTFSGHC